MLHWAELKQVQPVLRLIRKAVAADSEDDDSMEDLDDEEWDKLWESGEEESSQSVFDIDEGWEVEDLGSHPDSPPRMDRIGRFDKQLRNNSKARKLAVPLTGRVSLAAFCLSIHQSQLQTHDSPSLPCPLYLTGCRA